MKQLSLALACFIPKLKRPSILQLEKLDSCFIQRESYFNLRVSENESLKGCILVSKRCINCICIGVNIEKAKDCYQMIFALFFAIFYNLVAN